MQFVRKGNRRGGMIIALYVLVLVVIILTLSMLEVIALFWRMEQARGAAQLAARTAAGYVNLERKESAGEVALVHRPARAEAQAVLADNLPGEKFTATIRFEPLPSRAECRKNPWMRGCEVLDQYQLDALALDILEQVVIELRIQHTWRIWDISPVWLDVTAVAIPQIAH